jgi:hypothetical protein
MNLEGAKRVRISKDEKTVQTIIDINTYKKLTDRIFEEDPKKTVKDKMRELILEYVNR